MTQFNNELYAGFLPEAGDARFEGKRGFYPAMTAEEYRALPLPMKCATWDARVQYVIFDSYFRDYELSGKVEVHAENAFKALFRHSETDTQLYSVCAVRLFDGTRIAAKWVQDSVSGAFRIVTTSGNVLGTQGGFRGHSRDMTLQGIVEKISSLIWTRRYWSCGEFKLLVPFTEEHARLLVKENIIIKRGGNEAAEIRYIHITKNSQGMEEIEVQGKFLLSWIGKRILTTQIITKDTTQNILYAIVKQTCTNAGAARNIPNFSISTTDADTGSGQIDYTSEQYANAQLAAETAAKAAKLGIRVLTNARTGKHTFSVYEGRDLTAGNTAGNAPCIFSQEFDNIVEQEYTNSVENLKTTAYVGGEEKEGVTRKVAEVGGSSTGLSRDEVFINATDIVQEYENESGQTVTLTTAQYLALLSARGVEELEQYAETLAFGSKINTNANLKYGTDYDLGDRVTCINKRWNVRIDVRITEIAETYETSGEEIDITFGESLPALLTQIRQITK